VCHALLQMMMMMIIIIIIIVVIIVFISIAWKFKNSLPAIPGKK
jgi:heme/copper-type cytochrome/quinol oxidase subunit 2